VRGAKGCVPERSNLSVRHFRALAARMGKLVKH